MRRIILLLLACLILCACARAEGAPPPERIELSETDIVIDMASGEPYVLTCTVYPEGADQTVMWRPSSTSMLKVEDGHITPLHTGDGYVVAMIPDQRHIQAKCNLIVINSLVPKSIELSESKVTLQPTEQIALSALIEPANAAASVKWRSYDESVVKVTQDGLVTAVGVGRTYVRVTSTYNKNLYAQATIEVRYRAAPDSITLSETEISLDTGSTYQIIPSIQPDDASRILGYMSSDTTVATVDERGLVSVKGYGRATITVRSMSDARVTAQLSVNALDARVPERLVPYPSRLTLEPTQSRRLSVLALPETASDSLIWSSSNKNIAKVDERGLVTAVDEGKCVITASSAYSGKRYCSVMVSVAFGKKPQSLTLSLTEAALNRGETVKIEYDTGGADASRAVVFESSDEQVAYVDEEGRLVAAGYGEAEITAYCLLRRNVTASISVRVEDMRHALTMTPSVEQTDFLLNVGESINISFTFTPATADKRVMWTSSDQSIVATSADGAPVAVSSGRALLKAVNVYNPELFTEYQVVVRSDTVELEMPKRRTTIGEIDENIARIDAVRACALNAVQRLLDSGEISDAEAQRRGEILENAFDMYDFAWMVEREQMYWSVENSENGAKNFKPGVVYYGMPYTAGTNTSRSYSFEMALESGYYIPMDGEKYYLYNQDKDPYGRYVGNDCSSFVALAYFKTVKHGDAFVKTYSLASDDRYRTFEDPELLRPGDIFVKWGSHAVMFLYWANDSHTQIVVLEQGGNEPAINTVSSAIYELTHYTEDSYRMRSQRYFN